MRHIMVTNAKGGCGKSTLATNIAAYFAGEGYKVSLADFDPQQSSMDWLALRPEDVPAIQGVSGFEDGLRHMARNADFVIIDAPARTHGEELEELVRRAETLVVPVMPSPIDLRATERYLNELREISRIQNRTAKVGLVANRVKRNTLVFEQLDDYLTRKRMPYLTSLREAQNYNRAYSRGLSIFELPEYIAWPDWEEWDPILRWLRSVRSH